MGIEGKWPWVRAPQETEFPLYNLDSIVVDTTTGANVTCILGNPVQQQWFRMPYFRDEQGNLAPYRFASAGAVAQVSTAPYLIPMCHTFSVAKFVLADFGVANGWRVDSHPRFVADLTGDGRGDIIGFGNGGVFVALNNGSGGFGGIQFAVADFGFDSGWRVENHPRFVVDLTGDGRRDVIGFGDDGVWVALNSGVGTFGQVSFVLADFAIGAGGWAVDRHPRFVSDLTGDGRGDILGFGDDGVWEANNHGDGTFEQPRFVLAHFGFNSGWRVDSHLRTVADLTGDGRGDIVGIFDDGVWVALNDGAGNFSEPRFALADFGVNQGWPLAAFPKYVADLTGDGRADIVGFFNDGVRVAYNNGDGTFAPTQLLIPWFGAQTPEVTWDTARHPRFVADLTGNGGHDIVGFADDGLWVAVLDTTGPVSPQAELLDFGFAEGGWRIEDHPRVVADLTGDNRGDVVGFGDAGVYVAYNEGVGRAPRPVVTQ